MITRGDIWWADLGPVDSRAPAKRRPVMIVQANGYNRSRIGTAIVAAITSNTQLADLPGNVFLPSAASGLSRDSVVNVTQLVTVDRDILVEAVGPIPNHLVAQVDIGLRRVLEL